MVFAMLASGPLFPLEAPQDAASGEGVLPQHGATGAPVEDTPNPPTATPALPSEGISRSPPVRAHSTAGGGFVENRGQIHDERVWFYRETDSGLFALGPAGVLIQQLGASEVVPLADATTTKVLPQSPSVPNSQALLQITFPGASSVMPVGRAPLDERRNYFIGADPSLWTTGVRSFGEVVFAGLYPGIDLVYTAAGAHVKYELRVAPGAETTAIRFGFAGAERVEVAASGELRVTSGLATLSDSSPVSHQGGGRAVSCRFEAQGAWQIGFACGERDLSLPLVIDPLVYLTYFGGRGYDYPSAGDLGPDGSYCFGGFTASIDLPATPGTFDNSSNPPPPNFNSTQDVYVAKFAPDGGLAFATYLGGGTGREWGTAIAVAPDGSIVVTGSTNSSDFPTTAGSLQPSYPGTSYAGNDSAFLTKLDASGDLLLWSTYLGGNRTTVLQALDIAENGTIVAAGFSNSPNLPFSPGAYNTTMAPVNDELVALFDAGGALLRLTSFGAARDDVAKAVKFDAAGDVHLVGMTQSAGFPVTPGAFDTTHGGGLMSYDVTYVKLDASLSTLLYSTFVGGSGQDDAGVDMVVGPDFNPVIVGATLSADFPNASLAGNWTHGSTQDAFILKLDVQNSTLAFSVLLGGSGADSFSTADLDEAGAIYTAGGTNGDFPTTANAFDRTLSLQDGVIVKLSADGSRLEHSTLLGGSRDDGVARIRAEEPDSVVFDGLTGSKDLPVTADAFDNNTSVAPDYDVMYGRLYLLPYRVNITTDPPGLDVSVRGRLRHTPMYVICDAGMLVPLSVPTEISMGDARYRFAGWSDGGAASHDYTCMGNETLTARYVVEFKVRFDSAPSNLTLLADSAPLLTPFELWWINGTAHLVEAPAIVGSTQSRLAFANWSDGLTRLHGLLALRPMNLTANYSVEFAVQFLTDPPGLLIDADGSFGPSPIMTWWAEGSQHTVDTPSPQGLGLTRHVFAGWSEPGPQRRTVNATGPLLLTATFTTEHLVAVQTNAASVEFVLDGAAQYGRFEAWMSEGSEHQVSATEIQEAASSRDVFAGWSDGGALAHNFTVTAPLELTASYGRQFLVTFATDPEGLMVSVNGSQVSAGQSVWWTQHGSMALDVPTPQEVAAVRYGFARWSDGGARAHNITVSGPQVLTASFSPEYQVVIGTDPAGLLLGADGAEGVGPVVLWKRLGDDLDVSAPSPQTQGDVRWVFEGWSDGGAQDHRLRVGGPLNLTVQFTEQVKVTFRASPGTLAFRVDGVKFAAEQTWWWANGSVHEIGADGTQDVSLTPYAFASWSDGGLLNHTVVVDGPRIYTITYAVGEPPSSPEPEWPAPPAPKEGIAIAPPGSFPWYLLLFVAAAGVVMLYIQRRRRRPDDVEDEEP